MGTRWSPYHSKAQAKYSKCKAVAEARVIKARSQVQKTEPSTGESTGVSS